MVSFIPVYEFRQSQEDYWKKRGFGFIKCGRCGVVVKVGLKRGGVRGCVNHHVVWYKGELSVGCGFVSYLDYDNFLKERRSDLNG